MDDISTRSWTTLDPAARLIGLIFLGCGAGGLHALSPVESYANGAFVMAVFSFLIGIGLTFGTAGTRVDKRKRKVIWWIGLVVPLYRVDYPLEDFSNVRIDREWRRSRNSKYLVYPVRLAGRKSLTLGESRDYLGARRMAEEATRFVHLDLIDASSGSESVRSATALDEPLRDRWLREKDSFAMPAPPLPMQSRIEETGGQLRVEIPIAGLRSMALPALVLLGFSLVVLGPAVLGLEVRDSATPGLLLLWPLIFVLFLPGLIGLGVMLAGLRGYRVTADATGLEVVTRTPIWRWRGRIDVVDLEELLVARPHEGFQLWSGFSGPNPLVARSDRSELRFGGHLPPAECEYLVASIRRAICNAS